MPPKVSVLTALGPNREHFDEAAESIARQTFSDIEWVIEEGDGLAKARNQGIRKAKGEYIAIQDADDISYPNRLQEQVEFLDRNPEISVVGSWGRRIGERDGICSPPFMVTLRKLFMWDRVIHTSAMIRKSDILPYRDVLFEDWDLWIRMVKAGKQIRNIPRTLVEFRFSSDNHSSRVPRSVWYMEQVKARLSCLGF